MINIAGLSDLLQKDVSRHEFLKYMGAGFLALIGITSIVKNLSSLTSTHSKKATSGYGGSPYGR